MQPFRFAVCSFSALSLILIACGSDSSSSAFGNNQGGKDASGGGGGPEGGIIAPSTDSGSSGHVDPNEFWANDPPPKWCGPDGGGSPPPTPGGTPECPDDKNRAGCPCTEIGKKAACWPGLRAQRNLGVCKDGTTTCTQLNEFEKVWGKCEGYQLPTAGATKGKGACTCFSAGQWKIDNTSPCFVGSSGNYQGSIATMPNSQCPSIPNWNTVTPPPIWSTNALTVDCAGHFKLCYELKAGDAANPKSSDCSLAKVCTEGDYPVENQPTPLPDLPGWKSMDGACASQFVNIGGYGEMSVVGESVRCDTIDDGNGQPYVFQRTPYCKLECTNNPSAPGCANCQNGGSGGF